MHRLGHWCILIYHNAEGCAHTYTNRQALHKQPISSTRQIWAEWAKKDQKEKAMRRTVSLILQGWDHHNREKKKKREKPGLLNLKQCWGNEDGFLFIATDFLFKRALLLCFLSRLCCLSLTSSVFYRLSPHTVFHKYRGKTLKYAGVNVNVLLRYWTRFPFSGAHINIRNLEALLFPQAKRIIEDKLQGLSTQDFPHAALCKHLGCPFSLHPSLPSQYDSVAEWRPLLGDSPPPPGHLHPPLFLLPHRDIEEGNSSLPQHLPH